MAHAELGVAKRRFAKMASKRRVRTGGLSVEPIFCPVDVADPFETLQWDRRTAAIKGESGEVLFEQPNCEVPKHWSQLATNVVVSKYFYGENGTPERENSVRQLIHRVTRTIADWGTQDGYFATAEDGERFYRELTWLCLHQHGAFNSPVWFNVGLYHQYGVKGAQCNWHWNAETERVEQPREPVRVSAGLRLLHPERSGQHGRHHGAGTQRGHALQVRLRHRHRSVARFARTAKSSPAAASPAARFRSCACTTRSRPS